MKRSAHRTWPRLGVVNRLMLIQAVVVIASMAIALILLSREFRNNLVRTLDTGLNEEVAEYTGAASRRPAGQTMFAFSQGYLLTHVRDPHRALLLRFADGSVLRSSGAAPLANAPKVEAWLATPPSQPVTTDAPTSGRTYRVHVVPATSASDPLIIAADDQMGVRQESNDAFSVIGIEAAVAVLVALASTYLLLRRAFGTIDRMTTAARNVEHEDLTQRINYDGPDDEIGRLARTFDEMLSRLEAAFQSQRRLLSDVSHQIRTPLTVIRGHVEMLQRGATKNRSETGEMVALVMDEIDRTTRLVDQLLLLGRSMESTFVEIDRVDLPSFMGDLYEAAQALAPRRWSLGTVPDVVVLVDAAKLRGALLNLVDNAVKATTPDDSIRLEADAGAELVLTVADSGRGIPLDRQAALFDRFARGEHDERGAGLGLAIVKAVAEGHGGRVTLESAPDAGCSVHIILPASRIERESDRAALDVP